MLALNMDDEIALDLCEQSDEDRSDVILLLKDHMETLGMSSDCCDSADFWEVWEKRMW